MRIGYLFEDKIGPVFHKTDLKFVFHMTDHHGFAYTVANNALKPLRQSDVSVTTNPRKNGIYGYSHYDFKFVLNAKPLIETYGAQSYDYYTREISYGGRSKMKSLQEDELRIKTDSIEPFKDYALGVVLLKPMFSQSTIQWLLYDNNERSGGFMSTAKSAAPRAIVSLHEMVYDWNKRLWMGPGYRKPNAQEMQFLDDAYAVHESGGDFQEGMKRLSDKYPVVDHFGKNLDSQIIRRKAMSKKMVELLNNYYQNRKYRDVDVNKVHQIVTTCIHMLGMGSNIESVIMGAINDAGLFHYSTAPIDWGIILKPLMYGDVDEALESIQFIRDKLRHHHDREPNEMTMKYGTHYGTDF